MPDSLNFDDLGGATGTVTTPPPPKPDMPGVDPNDWSTIYNGAGNLYGVDPNLLRSIVEVESHGDASAVGEPTATGDRAHGPAQIMPDTAKRFGITDPHDPTQAIYGAAQILRDNYKRFGNVDHAVAAYHGGPNTQNWGPLTHDYVRKVTNAYKSITAPPVPPKKPQQATQEAELPSGEQGFADGGSVSSGTGKTKPSFLDWFVSRRAPGYEEAETQLDPNTVGAARQRALKAEQGTVNDEYNNNDPYFRAGRADMDSKNVDEISMADGGSVTPELSGESGMGTSSGGSSNDTYGGGRAGVNFKTGFDSDLSVGISGEFSRSHGTDEGQDWKDTHHQLTGADATYRKGNTSYSLQYNKTPPESRRNDKSVIFSVGTKFATGGVVRGYAEGGKADALSFDDLGTEPQAQPLSFDDIGAPPAAAAPVADDGLEHLRQEMREGSAEPTVKKRQIGLSMPPGKGPTLTVNDSIQPEQPQQNAVPGLRGDAQQRVVGAAVKGFEEGAQTDQPVIMPYNDPRLSTMAIPLTPEDQTRIGAEQRAESLKAGQEDVKRNPTGAETEGLPDLPPLLKDTPAGKRIGNTALRLGMSAVDLFGRAYMGVATSGVRGGEQALIESGVDPGTANQIANDVLGYAEVGGDMAIGAHMPHPPEVKVPPGRDDAAARAFAYGAPESMVTPRLPAPTEANRPSAGGEPPPSPPGAGPDVTVTPADRPTTSGQPAPPPGAPAAEIEAYIRQNVPGLTEGDIQRVEDAPKDEGTAKKPVVVKTPEDLAVAEAQVATPTTEKQKENGDYEKGHINFQGLAIAIENPRGSIRQGPINEETGQPEWQVQMPAAYGEIKRTEGADGEKVDTYVGRDVNSPHVFVVDQHEPGTQMGVPGDFDEHKVFLGFPDFNTAVDTYMNAFSDGSGPSRIGAVTPMTMDQFKNWLKKGDTTKPLVEQPEFYTPAKVETPVDTGTPEHPGLVIKSLQTGKTETIQPPGTRAPAVVPPPAPGTVRMYSTAGTEADGSRWASPNLDYVEAHRPGVPVSYVDVPKGHPDLVDITGSTPGDGITPQYSNSKLSPDLAAKFQPYNPTGQKPPAKQPLAPPVTTAAPPPAPEAPPEPAPKAGTYGAGNKFFNESAAEAARARLREKLKGRLNAGFDPTILSDGIILAGYHIEAGARKFAEFAKRMVEDLGESVRPYLKAFYEGVRNYPEFDAAGMSHPETMDAEHVGSAVASRFAAGEGFKTIVQARAFAKSIIGHDMDPKALEEAIEVGVVSRARDIVAAAQASGEPPDETFKKLVDLYKKQPNLAERTSTSMENQAYSTPAPLAYAAANLADIGPRTKVYEPTAGNGMLLMTADPRNITANELNPDRALALRNTLGEHGATILEGDAMALEPGNGAFDAVIANPPFGKVFENGKPKQFDLDGLRTPEVDQAIAWQSLKAMKEDGHAVLIIGSKKGDSVMRLSGYRAEPAIYFFKKLYNDYNVTDHFTVNGDLYSRQGAGWPVDVIVINGRGKSKLQLPSKVAPKVLNTWKDVGEKLNAGNRVDTAQQPVGAGNNPAPAPTEQAANAPAVPVPAGGSNRPPRGQGNAGAGEAPVVGVRQPGGEVGPAQQPQGGGGDTGGQLGVAGGESGVPIGPGAGPVEERPVGDTGVAGGEPAGLPRDAISDRPRLERNNIEAETTHQIRYTPTSNARFAVGTLVPRNMQAAMSRALAALQERVGDIDEYVANKLGYRYDQVVGGEKPGFFSAEQVDAIALAIDNVDRGAGIVIGDQTGVGKGRIVAAMLRYAMQEGKTPVFVTKDPGLYGDMVRDLRDIGMPDAHNHILVTNNGLRNGKAVPLSQEEGDILQSLPPAKQKAAINHIVTTGSLPEGYDMLFTTYSQMQYAPGGKIIPRQEALQALVNNAMVVMDESHEAGGTDTKKFDPKTGEEVPSRADFFRDIVNRATGVVYSSATYAKNPTVMSLYSRTDLSQAVDKMEDLAPTIQAGGTPLQQVVANMLTEAGQYVRRERSFDGVDFSMDTLPTDMVAGEQAAKALRTVFTLDTDFMTAVREGYIEELMAEQGSKGGMDSAVGESSASSTNFASTMHNVVSQMLLALKAKATVDKAIELYKNGEKPIIALSNTNAMILKDFVEESKLKTGDKAHVTFNTILERYLRRLRRVTIKPTPDEKVHVYLTDDDIRKYGGPDALEAYKTAEKEIREADLKELPASPIDYILDRLNAAGIKAGEITGRNVILKDGVITRREATPAAKKRTMNAFNAGGLDALVINRSGSTGFSLHATADARNDGKQRHMIVLQADPNIDTFMQMLGRIHRTGQIKLPRYTIAVSDLAVEKRPAAVLMRKMASLNANTTASKRSAVSLDNVKDFLNKYGDEVVADFLHDNPEIANLTDVHPSVPGDNNGPSMGNDGIAQKLTGRLAIIEPAKVVEIYNQIERAYDEYIESLDRMGLNALEAKTLDLDARPVTKAVLKEGKGGIDSPFGAPAYLETLDVRKLGKPYTVDELKAEITAALESMTGAQFVDHKIAALAEKMPAYLQGMEDRKAEIFKQIEEAKSEAQKERLEKSTKNWDEQISNAVGRQQQIADLLKQLQPGKTLMLEHGSGDDVTTVHAVPVDINIEHLRENPNAASTIMVRMALADAGREVRVPLSKFLGDSPTYRLTPTNSGETIKAFESGVNDAREKRQVITGNLVSGFSEFKRGQIIVYTDHNGERHQGILMPREFDASRELQKKDVEFKTPDQVITFLRDEPSRRIVKSDDGVMGITNSGNENYAIVVNLKGGKPYFLNKPVRDIVGDFSQRRGSKVMRAEFYGNDKLAKVFNAYKENLGTTFVTESSKDVARKITGTATELTKVPPVEGTAFQRTAAAAPEGDGFRREGPGLEVRPITDAERVKAGDVLRKMDELLHQLVPTAKVRAYSAMRATEETGKPGEVYGATAPTAKGHVILWALDAPDPEGTGWHEGVHYLKKEDFFDDKEWDALEKAAKDEDWIGKHKIIETYGNIPYEKQVEEAIAHETKSFRESSRRTSWKQPVRAILSRINYFLAKVGQYAREVFGKAPTAYDVFRRMESGEIGRRAMEAEPDHEVRQSMAFQRRRKAARMPPPPIGLEGRFMDALDPHIKAILKSEAAQRVINGRAFQMASEAVTKFSNSAAMGVNPMALGSDRAKVLAKEYANEERRINYHLMQIDDMIKKFYSPEERSKMGSALDEQSVMDQLGDVDPARGLGRLTSDQRALVEMLNSMSERAWEQMKQVGIVHGEGLPHYMPRYFVNIAENGEVSRIRGKGPGISAIDPLGRNLNTAGPGHRKYTLTEETVEAAKDVLGDNATLVTDIRALLRSLQRSQKAIAGKNLINGIRDLGDKSGVETVGEHKFEGSFTIDHPAFYQWGPEFTNKGGKVVPALREDGSMIFVKRPIFVSREFEGPLRAVLTKASGAVYNALMQIKTAGVSMVMLSPMIHNAVIYGKAFELMPGKMLTLQLYRDGHLARTGRTYTESLKNRLMGTTAQTGTWSPAQASTMDKLINAGMVPINGGWMQDVTGIMQEVGAPPGRSLVAKGAGLLVRPVAGKAGDYAVRRSIDAVGQFVHGTMLWDRIADLQVGIATNMREALMKKGLSDQQATLIAAHIANRFAGVLPREAMSNFARKFANLVLFSRQFTLGNLGIMKDALLGVPSEVSAQLSKEADEVFKRWSKTQARRAALGSILKSFLLYSIGASVVQMAIMGIYQYLDDPSSDAVEKLGHVGKTLTQGYIRRWHALAQIRQDNPLSWLNPLSIPDTIMALTPMAENEPGKQNRIFTGLDKDGRGVYTRFIVGKVGEELYNYMHFQTALQQVKNKLSTMARPIVETFENSDYFGHKIFDTPNINSFGNDIHAMGQIVGHFVDAQISTVRDALSGGYDYVTGEPESGVSAAKILIPNLTGVTISTGSPLGPQGAIEQETRKRLEQEFVTQYPKAVDAVKRGDFEGARQDLIKAGKSPKEATAIVNGIQNPSRRLSPRGAIGRTFNRNATPEERERLENVTR